MRMRLRTLSALVLFASAASPQAAIQPEFEVATIKPSQPPTRRVGCHGGPGTPDPALLQCEQMSLGNLIFLAYSIKRYQLIAPDRLRTQIFDISATIPAGATVGQVPEMMRNLLIERFHLEARHASKEMPAYDLVVGKNGPKLKATTPNGPVLTPETYHAELAKDGYPVLEPGHAGILIQQGRVRVFTPGWTMERLATEIANHLAVPVTDATGLTGKYDIGLHWVQEQAPGVEMDGPSLPEALEGQLGLRLKSMKAPVDVLIVDHIDKLPTGN
jgi:uncharacterized protein (TIGR03435 family)